MIKKGVYAAGLSIFNEDNSLNIKGTISHATSIIESGLHGVFFFGSTGQSQLISALEKKELIATIANHKLKKQFYLGTGCNSLKENIEIVKYAMEYGFRDFLIMPPAYYKYGDKEVNKKLREHGLKRMFLHSKDISFFYKGRHTIVAPQPEDLTLVIDNLKNDL